MLFDALGTAAFPSIARGGSGSLDELTAKSRKAVFFALPVGLVGSLPLSYLLPLVFGHEFKDLLPNLILLTIATSMLGGWRIVNTGMNAAGFTRLTLRVNVSFGLLLLLLSGIASIPGNSPPAMYAGISALTGAALFFLGLPFCNHRSKRR